MDGIADLKKLIEDIQADLQNKATTEKIEELIQKIDAKDQKISDLENKVKQLEGRVTVLETANTLLERKHDDLESYTRRQNLRIVGIPEPADGREDGDACVMKVKEELAKLDLHLNLDQAIDRAHRVGPKNDRRGNRTQRPMIVRFTSWRSRTHVYTNRKKNGDQPRGEGVKYYVDLTKRRFDLKKKAQEKTKDIARVKFCYADVNNNICLMLDDSVKKIFNSEDELDNILANL